MASNTLQYFLCIKNAWEENKYKAVAGLFIIPHIAPISFFKYTKWRANLIPTAIFLDWC